MKWSTWSMYWFRNITLYKLYQIVNFLWESIMHKYFWFEESSSSLINAHRNCLLFSHHNRSWITQPVLPTINLICELLIYINICFIYSNPFESIMIKNQNYIQMKLYNEYSRTLIYIWHILSRTKIRIVKQQE